MTILKTTAPTGLMSFADIVKKGANIAPRAKLANQSLPEASPISYKERRLVLYKVSQKSEKIAPLTLRNEINKAFQEKSKIANPVVAIVIKSLSEMNIILVTIEQYSAEFLIQNKAIWEPYFKFRNATKDSTWHKVVVYGISTEIFGQNNGLEFLEEEIKIFNRINLVVRPNWLSSAENRKTKKHASAIIAFETKAEADKALRNRLIIVGISMRVSKCVAKEPRKFSHVEI